MSTEPEAPASAEEVLRSDPKVLGWEDALPALRARCDSDGWVVIGPDGTLYTLVGKPYDRHGLEHVDGTISIDVRPVEPPR